MQMEMDKQLIAPCGMYCGLCTYLYQIPRQRGQFNYCAGCRPRGKGCAWLKKRCELLRDHAVQYCFECPSYPCRREHLAGRYRMRYGLDFLANLELIRDQSEDVLLDVLKDRFACERCGGLMSIHSGKYFACDDVHSWKD